MKLDTGPIINFLSGAMATAIANTLAIAGFCFWFFKNRHKIVSALLFLVRHGPRKLAVRNQRREFAIARQICNDEILLQAYNGNFYASAFFNVTLYVFSIIIVSTLLVISGVELVITDFMLNIVWSIFDNTEPKLANKETLFAVKDIYEFLKENFNNNVKNFYVIPFTVMIFFTVIITLGFIEHKRIMSKVIRCRRRALRSVARSGS